jgi:hypothetical protein
MVQFLTHTIGRDFSVWDSIPDGVGDTDTSDLSQTKKYYFKSVGDCKPLSATFSLFADSL